MLPDAVLVAEHGGRVVFANRAAERLFGRGVGGLVGELLGALLRTERLPDDGELRGPALALGPGGTELPVEARVRQLPGGEGTLICVLREWPSSRVAASVSPSLAGLLEAVPVAIAFQSGPELTWESANSAYRNLVGGGPLVGRRLREVLPEFATMSRILREVFATGTPFVGSELPLKTLEPGANALRSRRYSVVCQPLRGESGEVTGVASVAIDVTDQAEARERISRASLERDAALRDREELISVAAHELRAPLTPLLLGIAHLRRALAAEATPSDPEAVVRRIEMAERQARRLTELVDSLLDVSRSVGQVSLRREQMDLAALIGVVVERYQDVLAESGCELRYQGPRSLCGLWDPSRLDQVLTNVLANAIKYGAGRPVDVVLERNGNDAVLTVRDRGIGLTAHERERIFQRNQRAAAARAYAGMGLGLWIARGLVVAHGGTIEAEGGPAAGATFQVRLPLVASESLPHDPQSSEAGPDAQG